MGRTQRAQRVEDDRDINDFLHDRCRNVTPKPVLFSESDLSQF
jgi:hypothetical protein